MRTIPPTVTDSALKLKLQAIAKKIDEKMNRVNAIRAQIKSPKKNQQGEFAPADLNELKQLGTEIDQLDREWKEIVK